MKKNEKDGQPISRRDFVEKSVMAATAMGLAPVLSLARADRTVLGANDRIGVGVVGVGIRGTILLERTKALPGTRLVEVVDLYDGHIERAKELVGGPLG